MVWYVETSAFLKLVVDEPHSTAMREWFVDHERCWSSQLLSAEAGRAALRLGIDAEVVDGVLETISLVLPSASTYRMAAVLPPATLRTLDALHLAAALELGDDLEGVVTYDDRLAAGAAEASVVVIRPTSSDIPVFTGGTGPRTGIDVTSNRGMLEALDEELALDQLR